MRQPLRIYLGDLTYDTIALATEVFPLNVGYVGAYCLERFAGRIEVRLFKYIADLDRALNEDPPDVLGLSSYCWNHRVGLEMFRVLLARRPHAVTAWGGPNFPADLRSRQAFLDRYSELDAYVPLEGEIGFGNLVERLLETDSLEDGKAAIRTAPIGGCVTRTLAGALQYAPALRLGDLDAIPSPYLSGVLDRFFDGRLVPMIQTNRGCPFTCSFCVDGSALVSRVNYFSLDRVRRELEYIGPRVPPTTHSMEISDLNFGMYRRDVEICDAIREIQDRYGWPRHITASTGKNRKDRIVEAVGRLNGTLRLTMSVQSTNPTVLDNVKRHNISLDAMLALAPRIKETGLRTYSEIIASLPGDTYETHLQTIRDLIGAKIDFIKAYTLMLLAGSELATPEERERWGFVTRFRPLSMDFATLSNGRRVIETEEVVVGSNALSFDEYVDLRVLAFTVWVMTRGVAYDALLKLVQERGIDPVALFLAMAKGAGAREGVARMLEAFRRATLGELWDSAEEIEAYYQDDAAYAKLLAGEEGVNLLNYFGGVVTAEHMEEWTAHAIDVARALFREHGRDDQVLRQLENVGAYCRGLTHNVMGPDRMADNPRVDLHFDIERWLADETGKTLDRFEVGPARPTEFRLSPEQGTMLDDLFAMHGNTVAGRGQALKSVPAHMLWRRPVALERA